MTFDNGMKPYMLEALFRLKQDQDRYQARNEARKQRPAPPVGQEYLDVAIERISDLKGYPTKVALCDPNKRALLCKRMLAAIAGGELRAWSASLDLPVDPGGKLDPDDCLVELASMDKWAGVGRDSCAKPCKVQRDTRKAHARQDEMLKSILAGFGHKSGAIPLHRGGKPSQLKRDCWEAVTKQTEVRFTEASFNAAWGRLPKLKPGRPGLGSD